MFGVKSAKAHNNVDKVNGRCDVVAATDLYASQLRNFIAKNTNASFDWEQHQPEQKQPKKHTNQHHHQLHLSTDLPNSSEPKSQYKDFKRKCKRAVYKFMKGLFDERKLQQFKSFNQDEPIYFQVSSAFSLLLVVVVFSSFVFSLTVQHNKPFCVRSVIA